MLFSLNLDQKFMRPSPLKKSPIAIFHSTSNNDNLGKQVHKFSQSPFDSNQLFFWLPWHGHCKENKAFTTATGDIEVNNFWPDLASQALWQYKWSVHNNVTTKYFDMFWEVFEP